MIKNVKIPEYSVEIRFFDDLIQCYDLISETIIDSVVYRKTANDVYKESFTCIQILDEYGAIIDYINVDLVKEMCRLPTNAGYIFNLYMDNLNHGFYVGTYEIGEFDYVEGEKFVIKRSYPLKYCSRGCFTSSNYFYLGLSEGRVSDDFDKHYLTKLNWKSIKEPLIEWKKSLPSAVMGISTIDKLLFLGLKDGTLQIWNVIKDDCESKINLFDSAISVITRGINKILITSWTGEIAAFSEFGELFWKSKISDNKISGVLEDNENIKCIDVTGKFFHINPLSGEIIKKFAWDFGGQWGASTRSNLIVFRDWFIATGGAGIWAFWKQDYSKAFHYYMEDPLIRTLLKIPNGFITGDDDGFIRLWKFGGIKLSHGCISK